MKTDLERRLDLVTLELRRLEREVAYLRTLAGGERREEAAEPPVRVSGPAAGAPGEPAGSPEGAAPIWPRELRLPELPKIELAELLGARALAWTGGVVTLLGVVFFFVLAVNRGWIGPAERVGLGALASTTVLVGGLVMRRRYGQLYSALAAVGAGLAGGYATLLAAAALYELVPDLAALAIAAGIAAVGTAISLAWSAQLVAGIGLVGATLVPLSVVFDGGLSVLGTAFVGIVFAATCVVAIRKDWGPLLAVGFLASAVQIAVLVGQEGEGSPGRVVALAAAFVALYLASGIFRQLSLAGPGLARTTTALVIASATLGAAAAPALLNGETLGVERQAGALLVLAVVYGVVAAGFFRAERDLSSLLTAATLTLGAIGLADLLDGSTLAITWAAEAAALAWLARRVDETRLQVAAAAYALLALGHALAYEAPVTDLYVERTDPADGVPALLAVALAGIVLAVTARGWRSQPPDSAGLGVLASAFARFASRRERLRGIALAASAAVAVYATSLGLLGLAEAAGLDDDFAWGQVALAALWAGLGAAILVAAARRRSEQAEIGGLVVLGLTLAHLVLFDLTQLPDEQAGWAFVIVAAASLAGGYLRLLEGGDPGPVAQLGFGLVGISGALAAVGCLLLLQGNPGLDWRGAAFLGAGLAYAALAAYTIRRGDRRDLATLLWVVALALGFAASPQLLAGTELVAAWAATAVALAWLADRLTERRMQLAALVFTVAAATYAFVELAPPTEMFVANETPADGSLAIALVALVLLALARLAGPGAPADTLDGQLEQAQGRLRATSAWTAGVVGIYAVSLAILGAVGWVSSDDLTTEFQRGHTAVSAFWGIVGLCALYLGLTRRSPSLRLAGFALFGISLGKLFLYDLSALSSVTRALSFLAVGAVLLLAGFFYQRLSGAERQPG